MNPQVAANSRRRALAGYIGNVALALAVVYPALVALSIWFVRSHPASGWRYVVAVLPMAPVVWVAFAAVRYLRQCDELERRIQLEALAFSFVVSALGTASYALLQNAGLPPLNPWWIWTAMAMLWGGAVLVLKARYR